MKPKKISIIGAGNMGEALIKGLLRESRPDIIVSDASSEKLKAIKKKYKINITDSNSEAVRRADVLILAVKPQVMDAVISEIAELINEKKLVISIAAGIKLNYFEKKLTNKTAVVRAMPNMPALIQEGISAVSYGKFVSSSDKKIAVKILSGIGEVVEVDESLMDAVTAISGSGPAYFFFLIQILTAAGVKQGLNKDIAVRLAVKTAYGAAKLVLDSKQDPATLREKVTSKGGTTEAAFDVLLKSGVEAIFNEAVNSAVKRSKELSCLY